MVAKNDYNTLPVDKGWAWAIALAGFITQVITGSSTHTNSVLLLEVLTKYNAGITTGSIMFMCMTAFYAISSVLTTTFLMPKIKQRRCLILGGLMCSVLSLGASFAPNIGVFITLISLKGISHGIIFVPSISLIPHYFKRLRSRASMIPWCGGSAAGIIAPFIIRAVKMEYGLQGAYMLLAAVELHCIVAGLLLRPPTDYRFRPDQLDGSMKDGKTGPDAGDTNTAVTADGDVAASENSTKLLHIITEEQHADEAEAGVEAEAEAEGVEKPLVAPPETKDRIDEVVQSTYVTKVTEPREETKNVDFEYRDRRNTFYGSIVTLDSEVGAALELMIEDNTDNPSVKSVSRWRQLYQATSLELWSFRWVLLAVLPGSINSYLINLLPTMSQYQGATLDQAALLVTIQGSVDLIGRVCIGIIADTQVMVPSKMILIAQTCMGVVCHMFRFASSFVTLVPVIFFIGLFVGSRGPLQSLVCLELVGAQKMPLAFSIMSMLNTLISSTLNPIMGVLAETTGSFVPVMHVIGSCFMLTGCLMSLLPIFVRLDVKHGRKS